jgi:hypothetical protein
MSKRPREYIIDDSSEEEALPSETNVLQRVNCIFCHTLVTTTQFKRHMRTTTHRHLVSCTSCSMPFRNNEELSNHVLRLHYNIPSRQRNTENHLPELTTHNDAVRDTGECSPDYFVDASSNDLQPPVDIASSHNGWFWGNLARLSTLGCSVMSTYEPAVPMLNPNRWEYPHQPLNGEIFMQTIRCLHSDEHELSLLEQFIIHWEAKGTHKHWANQMRSRLFSTVCERTRLPKTFRTLKSKVRTTHTTKKSYI